MKYRISYTQTHHQILTIEFWAEPSEWMHDLVVQLPKWRPGRYELANYAKNIYRIEAYDHNNQALPIRKTDTSTWVIEKGTSTKVYGKYQYLAKQMDAGGSWLAPEQLYVSPVNCLLQVIGAEFEKHELILDLPDNYEVACALPKKAKHHLVAQDYQEVIDSPFIASADLTHWTYEMDEHMFHMWIQGDPGLSKENITPDFQAFTKEHMAMFGGFPNPDFHFLIQLLPYPHYHGVEHKNSTVLTLGPADQVMERKKYRDFLGVASHELFHAWNVTRIRPMEMMPFDLSREAYHPSGYVTEGVTMYYGDLLLVRSGVYSIQEYFEEVNILLKRHGQNFGVQNLSIVESSKDLWLDGYTPGAPERRQSIYVEGFLLAFALDMHIRFKTHGQNSLEDVMVQMWELYGKRAIGYSDTNYWDLVMKLVNESVQEYYGYHYELSESVIPQLQEYLPLLVGCTVNECYPSSSLEAEYGIQLKAENGRWQIQKIDPSAPAYDVLAHGDEVTKINGTKIDEGIPSLSGEITLSLVRHQQDLTVTLPLGKKQFLGYYQLSKLETASDFAKDHFQKWVHQPW